MRNVVHQLAIIRVIIPWGVFDGRDAQRLVLDRYTTSYALDQFVVRGRKLSLLRAYPNDWSVFTTSLEGTEAADDARLDGAGNALSLGTFAERPSYQQLDALCREVYR